MDKERQVKDDIIKICQIKISRLETIAPFLEAIEIDPILAFKDSGELIFDLVYEQQLKRCITVLTNKIRPVQIENYIQSLRNEMLSVEYPSPLSSMLRNVIVIFELQARKNIIEIFQLLSLEPL